MRKQLADKYIKGYGIEIGGKHNPLDVPVGTEITYVDMASSEDLHKAEPNLGVKQLKVVIDDAEELANFASNSLDFIIANHVLEHCHDTIGTLHMWRKCLKSGGIAYIALPDKEMSFDKPRPTTTISHMVDDWGEDTSIGDVQHYGEWHYFIDGLRGQALEDRVALDVRSKTNIHFHVFDESTMQLLFNFMEDDFEILERQRNGSEIIWILRAK